MSKLNLLKAQGQERFKFKGQVHPIPHAILKQQQATSHAKIKHRHMQLVARGCCSYLGGKS